MDTNKKYTLVVHGNESGGDAILTRKDIQISNVSDLNRLEFLTRAGSVLVLINCQNVILMEGT